MKSWDLQCISRGDERGPTQKFLPGLPAEDPDSRRLYPHAGPFAEKAKIGTT